MEQVMQQPLFVPEAPIISGLSLPAAGQPAVGAPGPAFDILLGDTKPTDQYGVLGRFGNKVVALDLNGTNTISIFGVQGGGKSYTVGTVVEMATQFFPGANLLLSPLASVIFHYHASQDYPPEFVSMVAPNSKVEEVRTLQEMYGTTPGRLDDVLILTSADKVADRRTEFPSIHVEPILFSSSEITIKDWQFLMGVFGDQMYMKQVTLIMRRLRRALTLEGLREAVEASDLSDNQKLLVNTRLDFAEPFLNDAHRLADVLRPGRLVIVDLRDELVTKEEALGLFVVMLNIFANAGRELNFNKLIVFDEAHKYMNDDELAGYIVEVVRQMRHQGVSILIASQDPPSLPSAIIELSSLVVLHRFNSPKWLKHVQQAVTALSDLQPGQLANLQPGEAYVWASKATDNSFMRHAVKMRFRPRVTQHGGGTRTAV
ncbi:MAG: ATP-binding protein [Caldilineaceae bacterium]|nr:ATP-binding protein [Caldilineaceae bacterium]